jgi:hypothetical protein
MENGKSVRVSFRPGVTVAAFIERVVGPVVVAATAVAAGGRDVWTSFTGILKASAFEGEAVADRVGSNLGCGGPMIFKGIIGGLLLAEEEWLLALIRKFGGWASLSCPSGFRALDLCRDALLDLIPSLAIIILEACRVLD